MSDLDDCIDQKLDYLLTMVKELRDINERVNAAANAIISGLRAELQQEKTSERELLEALKELYAYHYGEGVQDLDVNDRIKELDRKARAAIAKATGGTA